MEVHEGAASFMHAMRNLGPMIERVNVMKIFVDDADACAIYDFVTNQPSIGVTPCAEWYRVEEGEDQVYEPFLRREALRGTVQERGDCRLARTCWMQVIACESGQVARWSGGEMN